MQENHHQEQEVPRNDSGPKVTDRAEWLAGLFLFSQTPGCAPEKSHETADKFRHGVTRIEGGLDLPEPILPFLFRRKIAKCGKHAGTIRRRPVRQDQRNDFCYRQRRGFGLPTAVRQMG